MFAQGYAAPFAFAGMVDSVTGGVSRELIADTEAEIRLIMAQQETE